MEELIDEAARLFGVARQELTSSSRSREVVLARQAVAWALHKRYPELTLDALTWNRSGPALPTPRTFG